MPRHSRTAHRLLPLAVIAWLLGAVSTAWVARALYVARPVAGLPAIEFRARVASSGAAAVQLTGDSGWGRLDRQVAELLARQGVPVTSLNSLRYFWHARTPQQAAADVDRLIGTTLADSGASRVVLVGYSMGADVLPFVYNRLPAATRARVSGLVAINPAADAVFEFHLSHWWNRIVAPSWPTLPEFHAAAQADVPIVCIRGRRDPDAACHRLPAGEATWIDLSGDHDFDGEYRDVAAALLDALGTPDELTGPPRLSRRQGRVAGSGSEPSGTPSKSTVDR